MNNVKNEIRFTNPEGKEVFRIPDGGKVCLKTPGCPIIVVKCEYWDDDHFMVYRHRYTADEWAACMEDRGCTFYPYTERRTA